MSTDTLLSNLIIDASDAASEASLKPDRMTAVDGEGYLYDVETGEVLGLAELPDRFEVDSRDSAEWALGKRADIEAEILKLQARKRAVNANLDAMISAQVKRLSWWDYRFESSLISFARSQLKGASRTVQFEAGKVSFRKVKGSTTILDMEAACEWMTVYAPEKVRVVKSVTVTDVLKARQVAAEATGEDERLGFIATSGESENVTIATGVSQESTKGAK